MSIRSKPKPKRGVVLVPAVDRALAILRAVAAATRPLSLGEITSALKFPKSSVLGICTTLVHGGLLQRSATGAYQLGLRCIDLSHAFLSQSNVTKDFREALESVAPIAEETVALSVLDGRDVVYMAYRNKSHDLSFNYRVGARLPASVTASGKVLLSALPAERLKALFDEEPLPRLTQYSVSKIPALQKQLEEVRRRGFAIDSEETRMGMCCAAAPVVDTEGAIVAAVEISMLKIDYESRKDKTISGIVSLGRELSARLGAAAWAWPHLR